MSPSCVASCQRVHFRTRFTLPRRPTHPRSWRRVGVAGHLVDRSNVWIVKTTAQSGPARILEPVGCCVRSNGALPRTWLVRPGKRPIEASNAIGRPPHEKRVRRRQQRSGAAVFGLNVVDKHCDLHWRHGLPRRGIRDRFTRRGMHVFVSRRKHAGQMISDHTPRKEIRETHRRPSAHAHG
ncbi:hypothetical protein FA95DRAFT_1411581, partial [Auriscalpium vulgare]